MSAPAALYGNLAHYYDRFCADVDYVRQSEFARRAFGVFCASDGRDCLDLACGTGRHIEQLALYGFRADGLDNSAAMLALAAQRCPAARLYLLEMAALTQSSAYDLITCFLYSIHYSHPLSALIETLQRVWRALKPGGVFLFNAVDARGIRNDGGIVSTLSEPGAELCFRSAWHYAGSGAVLDLTLRISCTNAQGTQHWDDAHIMTALTLPQLQGMLENCGFMVALLEHDYEVLRPLQDGSHNVIVVACKPLQGAAHD